jgi:polar amino acid transport system substrate-binding protein
MTNTIARRGLAGMAAILPAAALLAGTSSPAQAAGQESTFERINRTKILRVAGLAGSPPYFTQDIATGKWIGACVAMAEDLARVWDAKVQYVTSTYGNSVLDLQSNKIDIGFALNPTPARALSIGFTNPVIVHPFGCISKKGFSPTTWDDINKPEIKVACDLGSLHETCARRFAPKSTIIALSSPTEALLTFQSGRADVIILAALLGIAALGKNPSLGTYRVLGNPTVALPSCAGVQREPDTRFVEVVNAWIDMGRGIGQIREWMIDGIVATGGRRQDIPADLSF